jgi:hypothetical protein
MNGCLRETIFILLGVSLAAVVNGSCLSVIIIVETQLYYIIFGSAGPVYKQTQAIGQRLASVAKGVATSAITHCAPMAPVNSALCEIWPKSLSLLLIKASSLTQIRHG